MSSNEKRTWAPLLMVCAAWLGAVGCHRDGDDPDTSRGEATTTSAAAVSPLSSAGPGATAGSQPGRSSQGGDDVVPGQIIVKFRSSGPQRVMQDAQTWLAQKRSFAGATADGSTSLDVLLARFQVKSARPLIRGRAGLSTAAALGALQTRFSRLASAAGATRAQAAAADLVNVYRLDVATTADLAVVAAEMRRDPHVAYAQPNYRQRAVYTPNDPFLASTGSWGQPEADLWGLKKLGAEQAWNSARGAGVVVAVVDSGVDFAHPDIAGNAWVNTDEIPGNGVDDDGNGYVDDRSGWSTADDSNDATDRFGHGTHVAGTIAAQDSNAVGVVGVAPDAQIMAVKGLGDSGNGSSFDLAEALLYAGANGAKVVNNSWGCL